MDASRDPMSIVIEDGHVRMMSIVRRLFSRLLDRIGYTDVLLLGIYFGTGPFLPSKSAKHCVAK